MDNAIVRLSSESMTQKMMEHSRRSCIVAHIVDLKHAAAFCVPEWPANSAAVHNKWMSQGVCPGMAASCPEVIRLIEKNYLPC
jgi:hypothetical protein